MEEEKEKKVLNRCLIVWGRHEGLSSIPHLRYPPSPRMPFPNRRFYLKKILGERRVFTNTQRDKGIQDRVTQKI